VTVLILGKGNSGKSRVCTYLVNNLIKEKFKIAVLDGDIGQSDMGPSGTVAFALASKAVTDCTNKLANAYFVGFTSPLRAAARTIEGLVLMKAEILQKTIDFLVVNTDGWVAGDVAVAIKTSIIKELRPEIVVGLQIKDELEAIIAKLETKLILIEP